MEIDVSECRRAGTRIKYCEPNGCIQMLEDQCVVFPDDLNEGYYVALSESSSKVGCAKTRENAYKNLIIGISTAFKYAMDNKIYKSIGFPSDHEIWGDDTLLNSIHRMKVNTQKELIRQVESFIKEKYEKVGKVQVDYKGLGETGIGIEAILEEVA